MKVHNHIGRWALKWHALHRNFYSEAIICFDDLTLSQLLGPSFSSSAGNFSRPQSKVTSMLQWLARTHTFLLHTTLPAALNLLAAWQQAKVLP
ncbi:Uncharacterized protein TCM_046110 [Theobroma cacao]|uniref:Uncharacterized protein n=1 Tax=Theobroma cacao TaxID=3641 RepID=S1SMX5_THECC|nr:Uncharacterized protein TCM_046110 [Theobroma cacao]